VLFAKKGTTRGRRVDAIRDPKGSVYHLGTLKEKKGLVVHRSEGGKASGESEGKKKGDINRSGSQNGKDNCSSDFSCLGGGE